MSETEAQNEPSMEEILASIRRIITEDDSGDKSASEVAEGGDEADDEEPVELTRMVDDKGQVVDLQAADEADAEEKAAPSAADEEGDDVKGGLAPSGDETPAADSAAKSDEEEPAVELVEPTAEESSPEHQEAETGKAAAENADGAEEADGKGLVSPQTEQATTASLAEVVSAVAVPDQESTGSGGERTLEAVIRDALQPELRGWLDQNLAPLVERIVREEIKKLVRRVEDR